MIDRTRPLRQEMTRTQVRTYLPNEIAVTNNIRLSSWLRLGHKTEDILRLSEVVRTRVVLEKLIVYLSSQIFIWELSIKNLYE